MQLNFITAAIDDLPWITEVYNSIIAGRMVTADMEPVSVESKLPWFHEHDDSRPLWVVEADGQRIGWASLQDFYGRPAYRITAEVSIYLDEAVRGKGFGKLVLQQAIEKSLELGIENLLGFIFEHNIPSINLFEKAGFQRWAVMHGIAVLDGIHRSLVIMGKKIQ
ncbi:GNAT family N-acetyltransferase [Deminuibacter soli]|uniref:N-acetyltransferase n=1 Tax=Deminuibacter soli TaxID=2291815 RepID=A0A3E1NJ50_9BACT|nr:GNAT family N-acetyltransferase [Deminuibacter soli]RFM27959.1 N-acetyltransferase [Deminuibacter soli]